MKSQQQLHHDAESFDLIGQRRLHNMRNGVPYTIHFNGRRETMSEHDAQGVHRSTNVHRDGFVQLNASNLAAMPIEARNIRIKQLFAEGIPVIAIAQQADLTPQRVYQILAE